MHASSQSADTQSAKRTETRAHLRRRLRRARARQTPVERQQSARAVLAQLRKLQWYRKARRVALYYPVGAELDPRGLRVNSHGRRKQFFLPVLAPGRTPTLRFAPWTRATRWWRNRYRIPEPRLDRKALWSAHQLDLVIVPLVGFDAQRTRLGAGGGFYDRTFAYRHGRAPWRRPRLVAVAFDCQQVDKLDSQPWDVRPDLIVAPSGIVR